MLEWLRPKRSPAEPVIYTGELVVERPADEVYALIDWADPRNAKRELGNDVDELGDGRFELRLAGLPDHRFDIVVADAQPGRAYEFESEIVPRIGRLERSAEAYGFEPIDENSCRLKLTTTAHFKAGLRMKEYQREVATMAVACQRALLKLKIHAEEGAEVIRAIEAE